MTEFQQIGKYKDLRKIGEGGFGNVYLGRDPFIKRLVAVKICTSDNKYYQNRFVREAKIAGNLLHRNIVTVFEFGFEQGLPYLVQEFLSGEDLKQKISQRHDISYATRLLYLLQVAEGLRYAHDKGVLHRDIKPSNVRILENDQAKILDFGIAKLEAAETTLTAVGTVMGTGGYLPPEQLLGKEVDNRADIFSYGAVAYELLTSERAFPGKDFQERGQNVLTEEPEPISTYWPECPAELAGLVFRCLAKEPANRYSDCGEITSELRSLRNQLRLAPATGNAKTIARTPRRGVPATAKQSPERPANKGRASQRHLVRTSTDSEPTARAKAAPAPPVAPRFKLVVATALLAILAVAVAWWRLGSGRPQAAVNAGQAKASMAAAGSVAGRVTVDALPWAELTEILDANGEQVPLPESSFTPLLLELPEGSYELFLSHPSSPAPRSCGLEVRQGECASCLIDFVKVEVAQYFAEQKW